MKFLVCMQDFDAGLKFSGDLNLFRSQCAYHRITNKSVFGFTDAHVNYGIDVLELIGQPAFDIGSAVEDAVSRDAWVTGAEATVTTTTVDNEVSYDIRVTIKTVDDKTLELRVKASGDEVSIQ